MPLLTSSAEADLESPAAPSMADAERPVTSRRLRVRRLREIVRHFTWIEDIVGIEGALDFAKYLEQVAATSPYVPTASQTVPVFA